MIAHPAPAAIRAARESAALTQTAAAALVGSKLRTWQDWESGTAAINAAAWELFLLKTGQHPTDALSARI